MDELKPPATRRYQSELLACYRRGPKIGLLALAADATIEDEWRALLELDGDEDGAGFYTARVPCDTEINPDSLRATELELRTAAASLLPGIPLDVIAFACTSATLMIGEDRVQAALSAVRPGLPFTTPLTAAKVALDALAASSIGLLTPYVDSINQPLAEHFKSSGYPVAAVGSFFVCDDREVARIAPASIARACRHLVREQPLDAVFVACTGLRAAALVPHLEAELGLPVTTSNHAMAWHALKLAGAAVEERGRGTLFSR